MRLFSFFLLSMFLVRAHNFLIPTRYIGTWKTITTTEPMGIFQIKNDVIQTEYKQSIISMKIKDVKELNNTIDIHLDQLEIDRIPRNINIKNLWKALEYISSIKKNGLGLQIKDETEDIKHISFSTGKLSGNFRMLRLLDNN